MSKTLRRVARTLLAAAVASGALVSSAPTSALAYSRLVCPTSGLVVRWSSSTIKYAAFGGAYGSSITASRNAWNNGQSSATLVAVSPTSGDPFFNVVIANYGNALSPGITRRPGTASGYPGCSGNYWTPGEMETVTNTYYGTTSFRLQNTTVHEIGHSLGLAHNSATFACNGGPGLGYISIMYPTLASASGDCAINTPRTDDAIGVNAIY